MWDGAAKGNSGAVTRLSRCMDVHHVGRGSKRDSESDTRLSRRLSVQHVRQLGQRYKLERDTSQSLSLDNNGIECAKQSNDQGRVRNERPWQQIHVMQADPDVTQ